MEIRNMNEEVTMAKKDRRAARKAAVRSSVAQSETPQQTPHEERIQRGARRLIVFSTIFYVTAGLLIGFLTKQWTAGVLVCSIGIVKVLTAELRSRAFHGNSEE